MSNARFPLTLTLSLGEREQQSQPGRKIKCAGSFAARRRILPLPKGEGWGEGEPSVISRQALRSRHPSLAPEVGNNPAADAAHVAATCGKLYPGVPLVHGAGASSRTATPLRRELPARHRVVGRFLVELDDHAGHHPVRCPPLPQRKRSRGCADQTDVDAETCMQKTVGRATSAT